MPPRTTTTHDCVFEIYVGLDTIRNVDLLRQGLYYINARVYTVNENAVSTFGSLALESLNAMQMQQNSTAHTTSDDKKDKKDKKEANKEANKEQHQKLTKLFKMQQTSVFSADLQQKAAEDPYFSKKSVDLRHLTPDLVNSFTTPAIVDRVGLPYCIVGQDEREDIIKLNSKPAKPPRQLLKGIPTTQHAQQSLLFKESTKDSKSLRDEHTPCYPTCGSIHCRISGVCTCYFDDIHHIDNTQSEQLDKHSPTNISHASIAKNSHTHDNATSECPHQNQVTAQTPTTTLLQPAPHYKCTRNCYPPSKCFCPHDDYTELALFDENEDEEGENDNGSRLIPVGGALNGPGAMKSMVNSMGIKRKRFGTSFIDHSQYTFSSQIVRVQYFDQQIVLNDNCLFRIELPPPFIYSTAYDPRFFNHFQNSTNPTTPSNAPTPLYIDVSLYFSDYTSSDAQRSTPAPAPDKFHLVSTKTLCLPDIFASSTSSAYAIRFDNNYLAQCNIMIHTTLIEQKFRSTVSDSPLLHQRDQSVQARELSRDGSTFPSTHSSSSLVNINSQLSSDITSSVNPDDLQTLVYTTFPPGTAPHGFYDQGEDFVRECSTVDAGIFLSTPSMSTRRSSTLQPQTPVTGSTLPPSTIESYRKDDKHPNALLGSPVLTRSRHRSNDFEGLHVDAHCTMDASVNPPVNRDANSTPHPQQAYVIQGATVLHDATSTRCDVLLSETNNGEMTKKELREREKKLKKLEKEEKKREKKIKKEKSDATPSGTHDVEDYDTHLTYHVADFNDDFDPTIDLHRISQHQPPQTPQQHTPLSHYAESIASHSSTLSSTTHFSSINSPRPIKQLPQLPSLVIPPDLITSDLVSPQQVTPLNQPSSTLLKTDSFSQTYNININANNPPVLSPSSQQQRLDSSISSNSFGLNQNINHSRTPNHILNGSANHNTFTFSGLPTPPSPSGANVHPLSPQSCESVPHSQTTNLDQQLIPPQLLIKHSQQSHNNPPTPSRLSSPPPHLPTTTITHKGNTTITTLTTASAGNITTFVITFHHKSSHYEVRCNCGKTFESQLSCSLSPLATFLYPKSRPYHRYEHIPLQDAYCEGCNLQLPMHLLPYKPSPYRLEELISTADITHRQLLLPLITHYLSLSSFVQNATRLLSQDALKHLKISNLKRPEMSIPAKLIALRYAGRLNLNHSNGSGNPSNNSNGFLSNININRTNPPSKSVSPRSMTIMPKSISFTLDSNKDENSDINLRLIPPESQVLTNTCIDSIPNHDITEEFDLTRASSCNLSSKTTGIAPSISFSSKKTGHGTKTTGCVPLAPTVVFPRPKETTNSDHRSRTPSPSRSHPNSTGHNTSPLSPTISPAQGSALRLGTQITPVIDTLSRSSHSSVNGNGLVSTLSAKTERDSETHSIINNLSEIESINLDVLPSAPLDCTVNAKIDNPRIGDLVPSASNVSFNRSSTLPHQSRGRTLTQTGNDLGIETHPVDPADDEEDGDEHTLFDDNKKKNELISSVSMSAFNSNGLLSLKNASLSSFGQKTEVNLPHKSENHNLFEDDFPPLPTSQHHNTSSPQVTFSPVRNQRRLDTDKTPQNSPSSFAGPINLNILPAPAPLNVVISPSPSISNRSLSISRVNLPGHPMSLHTATNLVPQLTQSKSGHHNPVIPQDPEELIPIGFALPPLAPLSSRLPTHLIHPQKIAEEVHKDLQLISQECFSLWISYYKLLPYVSRRLRRYLLNQYKIERFEKNQAYIFKTRLPIESAAYITIEDSTAQNARIIEEVTNLGNSNSFPMFADTSPTALRLESPGQTFIMQKLRYPRTATQPAHGGKLVPLVSSSSSLTSSHNNTTSQSTNSNDIDLYQKYHQPTLLFEQSYDIDITHYGITTTDNNVPNGTVIPVTQTPIFPVKTPTPASALTKQLSLLTEPASLSWTNDTCAPTGSSVSSMLRRSSSVSNPSTSTILTSNAAYDGNSVSQQGLLHLQQYTHASTTGKERFWPRYAPQDKEKDSHLIVFVHGYQGSSYDMRTVRNTLSAYIPGAMVLSSSSNEGLTESSFEDMGHRLAKEIVEYIHKNAPDRATVHRLSFICHSMGSLIARSALSSPLLAPYLKRCYTFVSLASPHCGFKFGQGSSLISTGLWILRKLNRSSSLTQLSLDDQKEYVKTYLYRLSLQNVLNYNTSLFHSTRLDSKNNLFQFATNIVNNGNSNADDSCANIDFKSWIHTHPVHTGNKLNDEIIVKTNKLSLYQDNDYYHLSDVYSVTRINNHIKHFEAMAGDEKSKQTNPKINNFHTFFNIIQPLSGLSLFRHLFLFASRADSYAPFSSSFIEQPTSINFDLKSLFNYQYKLINNGVTFNNTTVMDSTSAPNSSVNTMSNDYRDITAIPQFLPQTYSTPGAEMAANILYHLSGKINPNVIKLLCPKIPQIYNRTGHPSSYEHQHQGYSDSKKYQHQNFYSTPTPTMKISPSTHITCPHHPEAPAEIRDQLCPCFIYNYCTCKAQTCCVPQIFKRFEIHFAEFQLSSGDSHSSTTTRIMRSLDSYIGRSAHINFLDLEQYFDMFLSLHWKAFL